MNSILIVDTDTEKIENIAGILENTSYRLSILDSGEKCLDYIKSDECPDVVILGMQLIDMSGLDLVEKIRDDSDVPVIMLSNDKDIYTLVKAFDSGVNDYIVFPLNEAIFMARLKALIRRRNWNSMDVNSDSKNDYDQNNVYQSLSAKSLDKVHQSRI